MEMAYVRDNPVRRFEQKNDANETNKSKRFKSFL